MFRRTGSIRYTQERKLDMKRVILLLLLAAVFLSGCDIFYSSPAPSEPYTVTVDRYGETTTLTIDPISQTIQDGFYTYDYAFSQDDIVIYYPEDEAVFSRGFDEETGTYTASGEESEKFVEEAYIDGDTLVNLVEQQIKQSRSSELNLAIILVGVAVLAVGIWRRANPYYPWRKIIGKSRKASDHKKDGHHKHKHISGTKNRRIGVTLIVCGTLLIAVGLIL